jgi:hypothetical protein
MSDAYALTSIFLAYAWLLWIVIIFCIVTYVFSALGFYTMAKNKGIDHAWFAWIPFLSSYLMGELIDDFLPFGDNKLPYAKWILTFGGFVSLIPVIGGFLSIVYCVYFFIALYRLYKLYKPDSATLYLVLSIIFEITMPFFIFSIRDNTPQEYVA